MNAQENIDREWLLSMEEQKGNPFFAALEARTFTAEHYAMFLREEYFNTHENPESLTFMASHLKLDQRKLNRKLIRHALAESGHDQMAADDLSRLGYGSGTLKLERPLVTTEAFLAFSMFQIQHRNPISHLGYLYHLEKITVTKGVELHRHLVSIGIPLYSMTFLLEHTEVDPGHIRWNEEYIEGLVRTREDLEAYLYGLRGSVKLHGLMLQGIMEAVDRGSQEWRSLKAAWRGPGGSDESVSDSGADLAVG